MYQFWYSNDMPHGPNGNNKAIGSSFDDFLIEEGIAEEVEAGAIKKMCWGENYGLNWYKIEIKCPSYPRVFYTNLSLNFPRDTASMPGFRGQLSGEGVTTKVCFGAISSKAR